MPNSPRRRLGLHERAVSRGTVFLPTPTRRVKLKKMFWDRFEGTRSFQGTRDGRGQTPEPREASEWGPPHGAAVTNAGREAAASRGRQISLKSFEETSQGQMDESGFGSLIWPGPKGRASKTRGCRDRRPPALAPLPAPGALQVGGTCTCRKPPRTKDRHRATRSRNSCAPSEPQTQNQTTDLGAS